MNDEEFTRYLHERLESLHTQSEQTREAQLATARAVRSLADKLTQVETHRQADDSELAKLTGAVSIMISLMSRFDTDKTLVDVPVEPQPLPPGPGDAASVKKRDDEPTGEFQKVAIGKRTHGYAYGVLVAIGLVLLAAAIVLGWSVVRR
jgi:hypothetical protein